MNRCRIASRRGFTLIEAIASIVVLGVLGSIVSTLLLTAADGYLNAAASSQLHNEASSALDRMVREIRSIPLNKDGEGPAIESVTSSSISFAPGSQFTHTGCCLLFNDQGDERVLLDDVSDFSVQAYDSSGNALPDSLSGAQAAAVRRIQVTITVTRHGTPHTLRTSVFIRSTMIAA